MGSYGVPVTGELLSKLHSQWKCPCGVEFGDLTDHPQATKLCSAHAGKDGGYRGGAPTYLPGHEAPELFADFLDQHPEIPRPPGYEKAEPAPAAAPEPETPLLEPAPEEGELEPEPPPKRKRRVN